MICSPPLAQQAPFRDIYHACDRPKFPPPSPTPLRNFALPSIHSALHECHRLVTAFYTVFALQSAAFAALQLGLLSSPHTAHTHAAFGITTIGVMAVWRQRALLRQVHALPRIQDVLQHGRFSSTQVQQPDGLAHQPAGAKLTATHSSLLPLLHIWGKLSRVLTELVISDMISAAYLVQITLGSFLCCSLGAGEIERSWQSWASPMIAVLVPALLMWHWQLRRARVRMRMLVVTISEWVHQELETHRSMCALRI